MKRFRDSKPRSWALCIQDPKGRNGMFNYTEGLRYRYHLSKWKRYNTKIWQTSMTPDGSYDGMPQKVFPQYFRPITLDECSDDQLRAFLDQQLMCGLYEWEAIRTWIYQFYWFCETLEIIERLDPEYQVRPKISIRTFAVESRILFKKGLELL